MKLSTKRKIKGGKLAVHFSSKTDDWATPQDFFNAMDHRYGPFTVDVAAAHNNTKAPVYCTADGTYSAYGVEPFVLCGTDGLSARWHTLGGRAWLNPPYGRGIGAWVKKAWEESQKGCLVVCLLPARTDTRWFQDFIYRKPDVEVEFLRGRLKFGGAKNSAPFPSMVVVFRPPANGVSGEGAR